MGKKSKAAVFEGFYAVFLGAGGKPFKRLKVDEVIHGKPRGMMLVMDFGSPDAVTDLFNSDDCAALVPVRDKGFAETTIQLTDEM